MARRSQPIYKIDAITLARVPNQAPEHLVIKVRGTVKSGGWTNPILKPAPVPRGGPATRAFVFEATPPGPDAFVTQALTPIEAGLTVTDLSPETRTIVIHCETVAVSQELP
ncbi:MAG TPA: hypothetical protein DCL48_16655 [Alphaproteobacteria bacterium]|nr:hypothetical protein [Alphaproteobacteria bacterium]